MRAPRPFVVAAVLALLCCVATATTAETFVLGKVFDASKHKQVVRLVKPNTFNIFFLNWLAGPTEGENNWLRCVGKAHANSRARSKVKFTLTGEIQDAVTSQEMNLRRQSGKTNSAGRVEFFWALPAIDPFTFYIVTIEATFKGKKIDGIWLHCFFGYSDPELFALTLGRFDRFGFNVAGGTATRNSSTEGRFDFGDGSALTIIVADSSAGLSNPPIFSHDPIIEFGLVGGTGSQAASAGVRFRDDMNAINDLIFADGFESGNTSAWTVAAP